MKITITSNSYDGYLDKAYWGSCEGRPIIIKSKDTLAHTVRHIVEDQMFQRYVEDYESAFSTSWDITQELWTEEDQFVQRYGHWE